MRQSTTFYTRVSTKAYAIGRVWQRQ